MFFKSEKKRKMRILEHCSQSEKIERPYGTDRSDVVHSLE